MASGRIGITGDSSLVQLASASADESLARVGDGDRLQCARFFVLDLQHDVEIERASAAEECPEVLNLDGRCM